MTTIGSLFSGIGGLELGLERSGLGHTVWQVECDERCRAVLARHWPGASRFDDVRKVGAATLAPVDVICGGFPCQDVSSAGRRVGLAGARSGLWFEYLRIVGELRPSWVVVENVAGGARAWVDTVVDGLGEQGYACLPVPLAAADVGAPHERARIFIVAVANADSVGRNQRQRREQDATGLAEPNNDSQAAAANADAQSKHAGAQHAKVASTSAIADTVSDELRIEQRRSSGSTGRVATESASARQATSADAHAPRLEGSGAEAHEERSRLAADHWRSPMPDMVRVVHGLPRRVDADRPRPRIAALGNAVVPQCAEVIGHIIQELSR